eukprot:3009448-Amphidinium_carterae.1
MDLVSSTDPASDEASSLQYITNPSLSTVTSNKLFKLFVRWVTRGMASYSTAPGGWASKRSKRKIRRGPIIELGKGLGSNIPQFACNLKAGASNWIGRYVRDSFRCP